MPNRRAVALVLAALVAVALLAFGNTGFLETVVGGPTPEARRIVTGDGGEKYYTADHYDSFTFITEGS